MNIKAVVKVMNVHALLRVEKSRNQADLYQTMAEELEDMMRIIMNNRNLQLDKIITLPSPDLPVLRIYIGSDLGFCGSVNSSVSSVLGKDTSSDKIVIGKKLPRPADTVLYMTREQYETDFDSVVAYLRAAVHEKRWSAVELVYNHYYNLGEIRQEVKRIYPLPAEKKKTGRELDDFIIEGDAEDLLEDMLLSCLTYEVRIAAASAYASENTMRQNATTESLKKLDEREAEELRLQRKENTQKAFRKTIDSFIKQKSLNGQK